MVDGVAGQGGLQFRQTGGQGLEAGRAVQVLQEHIGAIGGLEAVPFIVDGLVGANHQVHLAVRHLQPGFFALVIVVREEGFRLLEQIVTDTLLDGDVGGGAEDIGHLFYLGLIGVVIPYHVQGAVIGTLDECVRAILGRICQGLELRIRHVFRVKTGAFRLGAVPFQERLVVDTVPRAIVHIDKGLLCRILQIVEGGLGAKALLPIDGICLVCRKAIQIQDLFSIIRDS